MQCSAEEVLQKKEAVVPHNQCSYLHILPRVPHIVLGFVLGFVLVDILVEEHMYWLQIRKDLQQQVPVPCRSLQLYVESRQVAGSSWAVNVISFLLKAAHELVSGPLFWKQV